jgi:hypothetical protein
MEKELKQLKVVLNLFQKFLELNKCSVASFELDAYNLKLYSGSKFYCNGQWTNSPVPIDRFIEDFMDTLKGNDELDTWVDTPDGGDTEIYNYTFEINPEERMVRIYGNYSYYTEGEQENNLYDTDELPEEIIEFLDKLSEEGHGELEVNFQGGGDSGWIEEDGRTRKDDNYKIPDVVENYCYELLNKYPGWEVNEGSQGEFYFDSSKMMVSFDFQYNEEVNDRELSYQFQY